MTVDIATLGLAVNSEQIPVAINRLKELSEAAKETGTEAGKLEAKNLDLAQSWLMQAQMAGKSRAEVIRMQADYQKLTGDARVAAEAAARIFEQKDKAAQASAYDAVIGKLSKTIAGLITSIFSLRTAMAAVNAYAEAEAASIKLAASLEITGHAAGRTAQQVEELAQAMHKTTRFDDDAIKRAAEAMTKFGSISGDNFDRAIKLSADLAEKMGTDIAGAVNLVGRALENSFGAQMLKRQGLLTDEQAELLKVMKDVSSEAAQQEMLMSMLEAKVGGLAEKIGQAGVKGAANEVTKEFGEWLELIGKNLVESLKLVDVMNGLVTVMRTLRELEEFARNVEKITGGLFGPLGLMMNASKAIIENVMKAREASKFGGFGLWGDDAENARLASLNRQGAAQEVEREKQRADAAVEHNKAVEEMARLQDRLRDKSEKHEAVIRRIRQLGGILGMTTAEVNQLIAAENRIYSADAVKEKEKAIKKLQEEYEKMMEKSAKAEEIVTEALIGKRSSEEATYLKVLKAVNEAYMDREERERALLIIMRTLHPEVVKRKALEKEILENQLEQGKRDATYLKTLEDQVKAEEDRAKQLNMTKKQLLDVAVAQQNLSIEVAKYALISAEQRNDTGAVEFYENEIKLLERRREALKNTYAGEVAKDAQEAWKQTAESIQNSLTDALMRGFESGKDFAKNFRDTLYNMFQTLILRPTIQAILAPIAGGISSMIPGSAGASGGGIGSNIGSGIGSFFGGGGSIPSWLLSSIDLSTSAGLGFSGFLGGMASPISTIGLLATEGIGAFGGIAGALGAGLGAAVPILGIALAIASAMGAFDRGGPKSGGSAGPAGFRQMTPNDQDSAFQQVRASTTQAIEETLRRFGVTSSIDVGAEGDTDPEGDASSRARFALYINGVNVRDTGNIDVGRDEGAVQERLTLEAKRALLFALQQSDLADELDAFFDQFNVDALDADALDKIVQFGAAFQTVLDLFDNDTLADGLRAYEEGVKGVDWVIDKQIESIEKLIDEFDGSAEAAEGLALATDALYQAAVQAIAQIENLKAELAEMFGGSQERYRLAGMDGGQQRAYWQGEIDRLTNLINTSTDPAQIGRYARDLDRAQSQLWGLLTPEEQAAQWQNFLSASERAQDFVNDRLIAIQEDIATKTEGMIGEVRTVMMEAAANFNAAADTMNTAANTQLVAANTPQTIVVRMPDGSPDVRPGGA